MAELNPEQQPGKILSGQQYDTRKNILLPYKETVRPYSGDDGNPRLTNLEGTAALEQTPIDEAAAKDRQFDISAIQTALNAIVIPWFSYIDIPLPDVLTGVATNFNVSGGSGSSSHPDTQMTGGFENGGSVSINPRSHAEASASIIPDVTPQVESIWTRRLPAMNYVFYMTGGNTAASLLTRAEAVAGETLQYLPVFKTAFYTLVAVGQSVNCSADADSFAQINASFDGSSYGFSSNYGNGSSIQSGIVIRETRVGPVINDTITVSPSAGTKTVSATVTADTIALEINGTTVVPAITNEPTPTSITATGTVNPTSLTATSVSAIPTSGFYIVDVETNTDEFGEIMVHIVVVDFSIFA